MSRSGNETHNISGGHCTYSPGHLAAGGLVVFPIWIEKETHMDEPIDTREYKGYKIEVWVDDDPPNPCTEWDQAGRMVCWHRRYNLGHEQPKRDPEGWLRSELYNLNYREQEWLEEQQWVKRKMKEVFEKEGADDDDQSFDAFLEYCDTDDLMTMFRLYNVVLPLYLYDHGGITMRTSSFRDPWDSGQVGFIYISHKDAIKEWGDGKELFTEEIESKAIGCLVAEVNEYDNYLTGEVYGYKILGPIEEDQDEDEREELDSCWGFFGDTRYMLKECQDIIDYRIEKGEQ